MKIIIYLQTKNLHKMLIFFVETESCWDYLFIIIIDFNDNLYNFIFRSEMQNKDFFKN